MSDQQDEVEFTENEVNDLNILLQSMSDKHCKEFGHFRLLVSLSGDEDTRVTSKYGMGKQTLLLLRQINNVIINQEDGNKPATLQLNFEYAFDEYQWPYAELYNVRDDEYYDHELVTRLERYQRKYQVMLGLSRYPDLDGLVQNCEYGKTTQSRGIYGLGCLLRSIPQRVNLVSVNLANNDITCEDVIIACNAFKGLSNLIELDMSHNRIWEEGAIAIFTTLLGNPSCNIKKLNLSHNRLRNYTSYYGTKKKTDPEQALINVLQQTNRSLVELNLQDTYIGATYSMVDIFVLPLFLDSPNDVFNYVEGRNHCLKVLQVDDAARDEKVKMIIRDTLDHIINFNKDGPQQALAAKLHCHFEKEKNMELLFTKELDSEEISKYLEFMGIHGDLFTLMKLVRNFQAQGSLF